MLKPKRSKIRNYCLVKHLLIYPTDLRQNNIKIQILLNVKRISPPDPRKVSRGAVHQKFLRILDFYLSLFKFYQIPTSDSVQLTVDKFSLQLNVINEFPRQIHGRSREARYTRAADWTYVDKCAQHASPMPIFGNGDVLTVHDYYDVIDNTSIDGVMIGRSVAKFN